MSKTIDPAVSAYLARIGRKGGRIGGKKSLASLTPAERTERAKLAAEASAKVRKAKAAERRTR